MINLNTNKQSIKELVNLGLTNHYKSHSLGIQRMYLLRDAAEQGLIKLNK